MVQEETKGCVKIVVSGDLRLLGKKCNGTHVHLYKKILRNDIENCGHKADMHHFRGIVLELIISVNNIAGGESSFYLHLAKLAISSRAGVTAAN